MTDDLTTRIDDRFCYWREVLAGLVRIPSVSAPGYPPEAVRRSAEAVAQLMEELGMDGVRLLELQDAHPAAFGEIPGPPGAPTILLYAHHDVQPPGPAGEWETEPFDPVIRDGRMYGRGVSDDKAGIVTHLAAIDAFAGHPPVGIKLFVEGEEEIGSANLARFLDAHGDLLAADAIVIADSQNWRVGKPALTVSLRGLVAVRVEVRTAASAVHSGQFGGVFPDAITCLSRLLATLHRADGSVAIPGLVEAESDALDLTADEVRQTMGAAPGLHEIGSGGVTTRMWTRPAISVLAIDAPAISEAINQLVPVAAAKVSMRIAPGQDTDAALNALRTHLLDNAPWGADVTVTALESGTAFALPTAGPVVEAFAAAMKEAWGVDAARIGIGGSIPFVADFADRFPNTAIVLTGPGEPTSAIHAPNESQDLAELEKGIVAEALALRSIATETV